MAKNVLEIRQSRIAHVNGHLEGLDEKKWVSYIEHNIGSPKNCVATLSDHRLGRAIVSWFDCGNLAEAKANFYVAALLDKKYFYMDHSTAGPLGIFQRLLKPLVSDNEKIIRWFAMCDEQYDKARIDKHKTLDFLAFQALLALRGEWDRLGARSEMALSDPPSASSFKKYLTDHRFYLALAGGNVKEMESVLVEMTQAKALAARKNDEHVFTDDLILTPAVIYAKIAWRHGYQVKPNSAYIPQEWLPVEPLANYDCHYPFLKEMA